MKALYLFSINGSGDRSLAEEIQHLLHQEGETLTDR